MPNVRINGEIRIKLQTSGAAILLWPTNTSLAFPEVCEVILEILLFNITQQKCISIKTARGKPNVNLEREMRGLFQTLIAFQRTMLHGHKLCRRMGQKICTCMVHIHYFPVVSNFCASSSSQRLESRNHPSF